MATIQGSAGGQTVNVQTSSVTQQAVTQAIFSSPPAGTVVAASSAATTPAVANTPGASLSGDPSKSGPQLAVLNAAKTTYNTNGAASAMVVGADNIQATIIDKSAKSNLVAATGAGANALAGLAGHNDFTTAAPGVDAIVLDGSFNVLHSSGADAIDVGGVATIFASPTAIDSVVLGNRASLAFVNGSTAPAVNTISGGTGSTVSVIGEGNTSVMAGGGAETFFVDTAAGNVTLVGNAQGQDVFNFVAGAAGAAPANITLLHWSSNDSITLHGYTGQQYSITPQASGTAVLTLTDGASITFTDASAAQIEGKIKTI